MSEVRLRPLADHHADLLRSSAISDAVRDLRHYWTATRRRELRDLGFSDQQQQVVRDPARSENPAAALVIPIWGVNGEIVLHQVRPDDPKRDATGRPIKYMQPAKSKVELDVPPGIRDLIGDPAVPLLITEGVRKADAAASVELCCVDVPGVWAFRGTNDDGGLTALAAWESVALKGRQVFLTFDSDASSNFHVHQALRRLKAFLESRGASVKVIYLPVGDHGQKTGLDDYLAAGHTKDELLALASDQLREPARPDSREPGARIWDLGDYRMIANEGIFRRDQQGAFHQLTDFAAFVKRKVIEDDGVEQRQRYELVAQQGERIESISVLATDFEGLRWTRRLHMLDPYVAAGTAVRDHARAAIDLASKGISQRFRVFTHLGWRRLDGERWAYLHGGGAIGADGPVDGVEIELGDDLARFTLPAPDDPGQAVRSSLALLELAPDRVIMPLLAAVYRAPIGYVDQSVYLVGRTGVGKSELSAIMQQHYGAGLDRAHLPGSWGSTANALRAQLFLAKDALVVVDDYAPGGGRIDRESWERKAAEILRAQGNAAGRGRADTSGGLRPVKPPRALLLTSGEDVPSGHSVRARLLIVEVGPQDVRFERLTARQAAAANGTYALAMAGYLRWLAPQLDHVHLTLGEDTARYRDQFRGAHPRTPTAIAQLVVGWGHLLNYALAVGGIDQAERERLWQRGWEAFEEVAAAQEEHQADAEPTARYFELLAAAISSGRAHVAYVGGGSPVNASAWGWRMRYFGENGEWQPQGDRVGWTDGRNLYLGPEASFRAAQLMAGDGPGIGVGQKMLGKRLREKGLLVTFGGRGGAVSHRVEGTSRYVFHVRAECLEPHTPREPTTSTTPTTAGL